MSNKIRIYVDIESLLPTITHMKGGWFYFQKQGKDYNGWDIVLFLFCLVCDICILPFSLLEAIRLKNRWIK